MKKRVYIQRILALLLTGLVMLSLGGCALMKPQKSDYSKGDNAKFVRAVARAVTLRTNDYPFRLEEGWHSSLQMEPYFAMKNFRAKEDPDDPSVVHYSCKIPGAVAVCFNMAYGVCFQNIGKYSKWVPVEGDVHVVVNDEGDRRIDLTREDNVFTVFRSLRYFDPVYFTIRGMDPPEYRLRESDFSEGLNVLLTQASIYYASLLGVETEDYINQTVVPELSEVNDHILKIAKKTNRNGYGFLNTYYGMSETLKSVIWIVVIIVALTVIGLLVSLLGKARDAIKEKRQEVRLKKRWNRELDIFSRRKRTPALLKEIVSQNSSDTKDNFKKFCSMAIYRRHYDTLEAVRIAEEASVLLAVKPFAGKTKARDSQASRDEILRFLCTNINQGMRLDSFSGGKDLESYKYHVLSMAGWSAAALGRIITRLMTPDDIAENLNHLSAAIEKYNAASKSLADLYKERKTLENQKKEYGRQLVKANPEESRQLMSKIRETENKADLLQGNIKESERGLGGGLGCFMLDNNDLPLAYLVHILGDVGTRVPRFINQGIIMGLVDWLTKNSSHPEAKKLLDRVIAVRANMIRSDNDLTFFEVRVPEGTSRRDYALLLKDVLHCANPSIDFCDTEKLLTIAEEEVPDCMDMLYQYPLRLIDPVNKRTMGFYKFKPYVHSMFVQYVPPLNTGRVIERYHEVDDRTKPLSSGLNLQLFMDPYAVIPTIYHEYQHFCGNRNEASVFLRTQMFSTEFYKKYKEAKASADGVFATLALTLGTPPAPDKREALNTLIKRYYGERMGIDEAAAHAEKEIAQINTIVDMGNKMETWCPEILMPHLSEEEDKENWSLIKSIIVRYDTVPKSVTAAEFDSIVSGGWRESPEEDEEDDDSILSGNSYNLFPYMQDKLILDPNQVPTKEELEELQRALKEDEETRKLYGDDMLAQVDELLKNY